VVTITAASLIECRQKWVVGKSSLLIFFSIFSVDSERKIRPLLTAQARRRRRKRSDKESDVLRSLSFSDVRRFYQVVVSIGCEPRFCVMVAFVSNAVYMDMI
jgi:hypothetical protein